MSVLQRLRSLSRKLWRYAREGREQPNPRQERLLQAVRTLTAGTALAESLESGEGADGSVATPLSQWSERELESWLQQQVARPATPPSDDSTG